MSAQNNVEILRHRLIQIIENNKLLQKKLLRDDVHIEQPIVDKELLNSSDIEEDTLSRKLLHAIEVQSYHWEKLQRKYKSVEFEREQEQNEREDMEDGLAGEYLFLRQQWSQSNRSESLSIDDRIDKLNKAVASLRGKMSSRLAKEEKGVTDDQEERLWLGDRLFLQLKEKLERTEMARQQAFLRLNQLTEIHRRTKQQNQQLAHELKKTKDRLKALEIQYLQTCKREHELNDRLSKVQTEVKRNKITYQGGDFTVEVTKEGLTKGQFQITRSLNEVRDFLQSLTKEKAPDENMNPMQYLQNFPIIPKLQIQKRLSLVQTRLQTQLSNTSLDENMINQDQKPLGELPISSNGVRFCRTKNKNMRYLQESMSQRSFYTKIRDLDEGKRIRPAH